MLKIYWKKYNTESYTQYKKFCTKHKRELSHGLNHEFPYKTHKEGYHINKYGYFSHCIDCLIEIHESKFGGSLFD